jgi:outer membrane protein assembly factor BamB
MGSMASRAVRASGFAVRIYAMHRLSAAGVAALALAGPLAAQTAPRSEARALSASPPAAAVLLVPAGTNSPTDWLQYAYGPEHRGFNPAETIISKANVSDLQLLFQVSLPDVADGAPALLREVATASGSRDLLFLTTKSGRLLALDAHTGETIWARQPASGPQYTTSSPAVDPNRQYVYGYGLDGFAHRFRVGDGAEVTGGGWPELATLKPTVEKGSSALAIATSRGGRTFLYVANGGYPGDQGDYQGHVTAIDLATGSQNIFNAACSDRTIHFALGGDATSDCARVQTAIWARVGVVYDPVTDRVFCATGNGIYDGNNGGHDWGDSVLSLHPDGTGQSGNPVDTYTPPEYAQLDQTDADLGSTAPAILPSPGAQRLAVQGGKDGKLRLLDLLDLSGQGGPGHLGGELQILPVPQGGQVLTAPAVWSDPADGSTWLFVVTSNGISGLQLSESKGGPQLVSRWIRTPGGFSPVVANGVLYYASPGRIAALDPETGDTLWSDSRIAGIHWESPIVANGVLYITDEAGHLTAYAPP